MAYLSVILAHPRHVSFNHAIAATVVQALQHQGHEVWFHDLYQENFDPVLILACPCGSGAGTHKLKSAPGRGVASSLAGFGVDIPRLASMGHRHLPS
jgi:hypothetical protein